MLDTRRHREHTVEPSTSSAQFIQKHESGILNHPDPIIQTNATMSPLFYVLSIAGCDHDALACGMRLD